MSCCSLLWDALPAPPLDHRGPAGLSIRATSGAVKASRPLVVPTTRAPCLGGCASSMPGAQLCQPYRGARACDTIVPAPHAPGAGTNEARHMARRSRRPPRRRRPWWRGRRLAMRVVVLALVVAIAGGLVLGPGGGWRTVGRDVQDQFAWMQLASAPTRPRRATTAAGRKHRYASTRAQCRAGKNPTDAQMSAIFQTIGHEFSIPAVVLSAVAWREKVRPRTAGRSSRVMDRMPACPSSATIAVSA